MQAVETHRAKAVLTAVLWLCLQRQCLTAVSMAMCAEGLNFSKAVSGYPLCCPFRGALLSGVPRLPHLQLRRRPPHAQGRDCHSLLLSLPLHLSAGIEMPTEVTRMQQTAESGAPFAVGESSVILLHPPSTSSRCFNMDGESASAK